MEFAAPDLLYAIAVISGGIVLLGWGIRFFRTVVGLSGFAAMGVIAFIILANADEKFGLGKHAKAIMLGGSLVAGLVGAALGLWVWMIALGAVGGLGGLCVALWVLSWPSVRNKAWVEGPVERPLFIAGASLAGCVLALIYEKAIIVAGTALTGSLAVCSGLDVFLDTGLNKQLRSVIVNKAVSSRVEPKTIAMLMSTAGLFLVGVIFQYRVSGREKRKKSWSGSD